MSLDLSKPIVWTSRGNVNEEGLERLSEWQFANERGEIVSLPRGWVAMHAIGFKDRETGEIVKRGVWQTLPELVADGETGKLG